jgi:hypothetical protein
MVRDDHGVWRPPKERGCGHLQLLEADITPRRLRDTAEPGHVCPPETGNKWDIWMCSRTNGQQLGTDLLTRRG